MNEIVVHDDGVIRETLRPLTATDEPRAVQLCYSEANARGAVQGSVLARLFRRDELRRAFEATLTSTIRTGTRGDFRRVAIGYFVAAANAGADHTPNLTGVIVTEQDGRELLCESAWGGDVARLALRRAAAAARAGTPA